MQKNILLVEDHPVTLQLMKNFLEKEGHQVITAPDGIEAIEILRKITPDIIFMDLIMPKISGDVLCKAVRKMPQLTGCYIVIISAVVVEQEFELANIGADAFIAKGPFNKMTAHIRKAVEQSEKERETDSPKLVMGLEDVHPRRITDELLSQTFHLRVILESMSEGILELYRGKIIYASSAAVAQLGIAQERLLGAYLPELLDPGAGAKVRHLMEMRNEKEFELDEDDPLEIKGRQLTLRKQFLIGEPDSAILLIKDVTERKRMESIAEAANLMDNIGYIFSSIRHEIGNPLNSIKMALTVLKKNLAAYDRQTISEFVERGLAEVVRIEYLLKALKNFSLFESPQVQKLRLDQFMENFIELIITDFKSKGIQIQNYIGTEPWLGLADPRALHQVLLNIFTNAADAVVRRDKPQIAVRMTKQTGWIQISVEDNGCGISEENREKLFKPFFTSKEHGTGLGLVIVKKMLAKMNCTIHMESQKDVGTTVCISIPEELQNGAAVE